MRNIDYTGIKDIFQICDVSFKFRDRLSSKALNYKIHKVIGGNFVFNGLDVSLDKNIIHIDKGECIIQGAIINIKEPIDISTDDIVLEDGKTIGIIYEHNASKVYIDSGNIEKDNFLKLCTISMRDNDIENLELRAAEKLKSTNDAYEQLEFITSSQKDINKEMEIISSTIENHLSNHPQGFSGNYNDLTNKPTSLPANGGNADTLDGKHASYFATSNHTHDFSDFGEIPNLTGYATEVYVNEIVADLIDSAPDTLNTLQELANALGNDSNFAATITNKISEKADKSYVDTELSKKAEASHGTHVVFAGNGSASTVSRSDHTHSTVSGNAGSATKLATARKINGVSFDGTKDITIYDSTKVSVDGSTTAERIAVFSTTGEKTIKDSGYTIATSVPSNAKFTDTIYTHPTTHPASMIAQDSTHKFVTDTLINTWNNKASTSVATTTSNGLMSSSDKSKLDNLSVGNFATKQEFDELAGEIRGMKTLLYESLASSLEKL